MSALIIFLIDNASSTQIANHLLCCDADFVPPLSHRIKIPDYAQKISRNAVRFEAWSGTTLIGLVAAYCNDPKRSSAYVTNVSVLHSWIGQGIATQLLKQCGNHMKNLGLRQICLQVGVNNTPAITLYAKCGYTEDRTNSSFLDMHLYLDSGK